MDPAKQAFLLILVVAIGLDVAAAALVVGAVVTGHLELAKLVGAGAVLITYVLGVGAAVSLEWVSARLIARLRSREIARLKSLYAAS